MKNFKTYEPEGLATSKPNYDNKFDLTKDLDTVNNDYSEVEKSNHIRYFQKWRFKNRARFKRSLVSVFTLFVISFVSCGASDRPTEPDRLPFGVFPLNDVRWVEEVSVIENHPGEPHYYLDTVTYSVRQVAENKAELHYSRVRTLGHYKYDAELQELIWVKDTTLYEEPELALGWFYLESKKVYWQRGNDVENWYGERVLLYDFSLNVGDTFDNGLPNTYGGSGYYVASIDNVLVGNEYRKRYNFLKPEQTHFSFSVIEGIGSDRGLSFPMDGYGATTHPKPTITPIAVYYKDRVITDWRKQ